MADTKTNKTPFWKKKSVLIPVIILIVILLATYGVRLLVKLDFALDKGLIVDLKPNEKSISLKYGQKENVEFNAAISNPFSCTALCDYEFIDRSRNLAVDSGNARLKPRQSLMKEYEIAVNRLGKGQGLYNFQITCRNEVTFFCPAAEGSEVLRSSLLIVNYEMTDVQKELKLILKQNVTMLLERLSKADSYIQGVNQKMFDLSQTANLGNLSQKKISINSRLDDIIVSVENLKAIWSAEDYEKLSRMFNESFFGEIADLSKEAEEFDRGINGTIKSHNAAVGMALEFSLNYENMKKLSQTDILAGRSKFFEGLNESAERFNSIIISLKDREFESYESVKSAIEKLLEQQQFKIEIANNLSLPIALKGMRLYNSEKDLLCLLSNCTSAVSVEKTIKFADEKYSKKELADSKAISGICSDLEGIKQEISLIKNNSINKTSGLDMVFPDTDEFRDYAMRRLGNITTARDNAYANSLEETKKANKTNPFVVDAYYSLMPSKKVSSFIPNNDFEALNMTLYHYTNLDYSDEIDEFINGTCIKIGAQNPALLNLYFYDYPFAPENLTYNIKSQIGTLLSDNPPVCCVFGDCKPCCNDDTCRNDPKTFPIILLHGHSVLKDNSVEYSLDAYNKIQHKLQEDGYINAGILSLYSLQDGIEEGKWGLSGKPVAVKVSYYYDSFKKGEEYIVVPTKSETIDTYSVRLKELVEAVKKLTGKPKVNIIANSMGGLVARRYIQIFGDDSVHKLIMTGTPNKGVVGDVRDLCPLLGENLECRDMQENSLFLNVLNDPNRQPSNVKMSIIAGSGCEMSGKDGDGIVLLDNALIPNAKQFIVKGKCEFGKYFHTEMLNVDKYPEVYKNIKEILQE